MEQAFPSVFWLEDILALFIILLAILLTIFNLPGNTLLLLGYLGYILVDEPRYLNMQTVLLMVLLYALGEIWDFCISYLGIKREHISWLAVTFIGSGTLIGTCVGTMFLPVLGSVIGGAAGDSSYNAQLAGVIGQNAVENNALETAWDVANLAIGTASFGYNIHEGNYGAAAIDGAGLVYDGVATAFPFLPAGASAGIKAYRGGNSLKQSINIGTDVANASKAANQAAKNVDNITKNPAVTGTKIHRETGQLLGEANGTASKLSDSASSYFKGANASTGKQPDMSWKDTGMWADLTTPKQWAVHEKKYNSNFGEGVSILYKPGQGVVKTTKLPTGAGVLITTPNNIYNNSQKEKK